MSWLSKTLRHPARIFTNPRETLFRPFEKLNEWVPNKIRDAIQPQMPDMPAIPDEPLMPEIVSEEASTEAMRRQRRRRGRGGTLLTGDLAVPASSVGKNTLLGS